MVHFLAHGWACFGFLDDFYLWFGIIVDILFSVAFSCFRDIGAQKTSQIYLATKLR